MPTSRPERAVIDAARTLLVKRLTPLTEDPVEVNLSEAILVYDAHEAEKKARAKERLQQNPAKEIEESFSDPGLIKRLLESFSKSRQITMSNSVKLSIVKKLKGYDQDILKAVARDYLQNHAGKHENYFFRIVASKQAEKKAMENPEVMWVS